MNFWDYFIQLFPLVAYLNFLLLGNEETHYSKRLSEYNIQDLKEFIKLLLSDFENELTFNKAEELLSKPKD